MTQLTKYQNLYSVDDQHRILVNLVYQEINNEFIGCYFGYEGGGSFSDGLFWVDKNDNFFHEWNVIEFPEEFQKILNELILIRDEFGGFGSQDEDYGVPSAKGWQFADSDTVEEYEEHWEYRSDQFKEAVIKLVSQNWSLSMRWS